MSERLEIKILAALKPSTVAYAAGVISEQLGIKTDWTIDGGAAFIYWRRALDVSAAGDVEKLSKFFEDEKFGRLILYLNDEAKFFI